MKGISQVSVLKSENPAAHANCFSIATFWYSLKIFKVGLKRDFDEEDLTQPLDEHRSQILGERLSRYWMKEVERSNRRKRKPKFFPVLVRCFGLEIFWYGIPLFVMELCIRIFQPLFVGLILRFYSVENDRVGPNCDDYTYILRVVYYYNRNQCKIMIGEVYFYCFLTVVCGFIAVIVIHPVFCMLNLIGMKIRIAVCSLIYRKVLRLDSSQLTGKLIGNVINILSNDVNKFENLHFIHYLWLGPATVAASIFFIYFECRNAAYVGMVPVMCCIPLQLVFALLTRYIRIETSGRTDNRVQVMNEIIQGIRVIKMYAWEVPFSKQVDRTRKYEMHSLIKASVIKGVVMSLILFTTRSGHFFTTFFFLYNYSSGLSIEVIFFVISFYQILRMTMTVYYPQGMGHVSEITVSTKRIRDFLLLRETKISNPEPLDERWLDKRQQNKNYMYYFQTRFTRPSNVSVAFNDASLSYGKSVVLKKISFTCQPGVLTTIIGAVGSGKSCILLLILGELVPFEGTVETEGMISYASQDPFLFAGSIRQNILFGSPYDRRKYYEVIKVCSLWRDFTILPYGDRTIVGEKGISLSGGQRARVNLARCVYREADVYLLDDPLSAVDTNVGRQLFDECINGYLKEKIVLLCTHQLQFLKETPQIIYMEDGGIKAIGNFNHIYDNVPEMAQLLDIQAEQHEEGEDDLDDPEKRISAIQKKSTLRLSDEKPGVVEKGKPSLKEYKEIRSTGEVGCKVLCEYYRAGGSWFFIFLLFLLFLLTQAAASTFDYYMSVWARIEDEKKYGTTNAEIKDNIRWMDRSDCVLFAGIAVAVTCVMALIRSFYFYGFCMRASVRLHDRMFNSVTRANLRFFTLNASGRILNRFSKDMGAVDEMMPYAMVDTYQILLNFVGVIGLLIVIDAWLLLFTLILCLVFYVIRRYYLKCSCSLKRLDGIARSPVFTHVNATLQGLAVIRSHGNEMVLVEEFDKFQDAHTSASFLFMAVSRAFGYLLDMITVVYTAGVLYYFVLADKSDSAEVALIVSQCIGLTGIFQWGMRQSAEFETQLTAVERVLEFTQIEPEPPLESLPSRKPPPAWPQEGEIRFKNVFLRYALTETPVLRNLTCHIKSEEKVGIVGRTGAGKSSMIACLFRLAYLEGQVIIDDIDTGNIGLHDLRKKISIIPQEPVIFTGTLRYNLDPFNEYSDMILFTSLADVDKKLAQNPDCLNDVMSEGGINLSVGSRQLVCLARAIVRNNKILILDEATANVDLATDNLIQRTIRTKFAKCTVLTIAHRLNTIMDSDKVIVMDAGEIVEFDHPWMLMQNPDGVFVSLIERTGPQNVERFKKLAKETYDSKNTPGNQEPRNEENN